MNITTNNTFSSNKCKPNFTAQLKGSAIRSAIKSAQDHFQLNEIAEILQNVNGHGDAGTVITCGADGVVSVVNKNLGQTEYTTKLRLNEKSGNRFLEMLRVFNSKINVQKYELALLDKIFSHSRSKQGLYDLYMKSGINPQTKLLLEYEASKYPEIKRQHEIDFSFEEIDFNKKKDALLKRFSKLFYPDSIK